MREEARGLRLGGGTYHNSPQEGHCHHKTQQQSHWDEMCVYSLVTLSPSCSELPGEEGSCSIGCWDWRHQSRDHRATGYARGRGQDGVRDKGDLQLPESTGLTHLPHQHHAQGKTHLMCAEGKKEMAQVVEEGGCEYWP